VGERERERGERERGKSLKERGGERGSEREKDGR
jgi:hypothetical protein